MAKQQRAVFINRTAAYKAAEDAAKSEGFSFEEANLMCRVYPVFKRGELKGFEAWYPRIIAGFNSPVLED